MFQRGFCIQRYADGDGLSELDSEELVLNDELAELEAEELIELEAELDTELLIDAEADSELLSELDSEADSEADSELEAEELTELLTEADADSELLSEELTDADELAELLSELLTEAEELAELLIEELAEELIDELAELLKISCPVIDLNSSSTTMFLRSVVVPENSRPTLSPSLNLVTKGTRCLALAMSTVSTVTTVLAVDSRSKEEDRRSLPSVDVSVFLNFSTIRVAVAPAATV